jgi:hypothetical protein
MLSQTSRQEIVRKINSQIGYQIDEQHLSPAVRKAISNLATVQRHLFVITELLQGENSRIERRAILRFASKLGRDSEKAERESYREEITKLQAEIDSKISEITQHIIEEENARQSGQPPPAYGGKLEVEQLKCPNCGAGLQMPTGKFVQCQFCKTTLTIQDVSPQIKSMIQSI